MIPITKPFLPERAAYERYLEEIWRRNWLTNNGPLVNELELELKRYLGLEHLLFVSSGTMALQLAIKALGLRGEVITTPFSYVATTSSLVWEGLSPVFVDIDPETLNLDPEKVEAALTSRTSAIVATHCFGNPCDFEALASLAEANGLKLLYDAAHCFGSTYDGASVFGFGDVSAASFHATKLFHTVEGGAVVTQDAALLERMAYMRNFGHSGPGCFRGVGINAKNSELHAAMGLCVLEHIDEILDRRKAQCARYDSLLEGLEVERPAVLEGADVNYAYYAVVFETHAAMRAAKQALEAREISPRRYFYPSLSALDYVPEAKTPISDDVARRVLCLPLYHDLTGEEQSMIARLLLRTQKYGGAEAMHGSQTTDLTYEGQNGEQ